jgi:hypothetical protein
MASTVDQRTTGHPVTSGRTSLAAERADILVFWPRISKAVLSRTKGRTRPLRQAIGMSDTRNILRSGLISCDGSTGWKPWPCSRDRQQSTRARPATPLRLSSTRTWPGGRHWTLRMPAWHTQERIARSTRRCCVCCSGTSPDKATYHEAAIRAAAVSRACPLWRSHMLPSCHL